jgi:predicted metal-dependent peptidase
MSLDTQEQDMQKEIIDRMLNDDAAVEAEKSPEQKKQESEEAKEKLVTARVKMLFNQPFFGNIACRLQLKDVTDEGWCPTAATDGRHFFYNRNFVNSLNVQQNVFLVGHEIGHCIYEHFLRVGDRDKRYWNMAGDYKINGMLVREKIGEIIDQVKICYDPKYMGDEWYTENVYDELQANQSPIKMTLDVHLDVEGEGDGKSSASGDGDGDQEGNGKGKGKKPTISKDDAKAISDELKNAVIQAAQSVGAGNVPAEIARMVGQLTEPKMDWRQFIRVTLESNLKSDFTFMRPNRKSQFNNVVLPSMLNEDKIDICLCLDASGSIGQIDATDFLSEVKGIMDQFGSYRIRVWSFDTKVYAYDEFTDDDGRSIEEYQLVGGGGTDFMCNWDYMTENDITPDQLIMFTDGEPFGKWGIEDYCDTLFLIKNRYSKPEAPFGQTIYYDNTPQAKMAA